MKAEAELPEIHDGILALMDESLILSASTGEPKVFYYKTTGDYYRILAWCAAGDPKSKVAKDAVDEPVVLQRQAPMIQEVLKTVEFPKVQYVDEIVDVPVVAQSQVPIVRTVQKTVEVPQSQFPDLVVDVPVVMQRQVPQERILERIVENTDVPVDVRTRPATTPIPGPALLVTKRIPARNTITIATGRIAAYKLPSTF